MELGPEDRYTLQCIEHGKLQEATLGNTPMLVELGKATPVPEGEGATDGLTETKEEKSDAGTATVTKVGKG